MDTSGPACSVTFGPPAADSSARNEQEHAVYGYLETLRRNGQVISDEIISIVDGQVTAFISVPGDGAWSPVRSSCYVERDLACLMEWFGVAPVWRLLGGERPELPDWKDSLWLYIQSHSEAGLSLRDGLTGRSIPLYTVPLEAGRKERLIFHARNIDRLDRLWLNGVLEMDVWREMVDPRSPTVQDGRKIARELEAAMERPVYYWLPRYYGFPPEIERSRPCPGCNAPWQRLSCEQNPLITFQCDSCRLISGIGGINDEPPAETIGYPQEFLPVI